MSHDDQDADRKFLRTFAAVLGGLAAAGILFGILANSVHGGGQTFKGQQFLLMSNQQRAERVQPVGETNTAAESAAPTVLAAATSESKGRSGQQVVEQVCAACHTTKFMNAPQIGNKEEWGPIVKANTLDTLVQRDLKGYGNMPPQGSSVNEAEARAAIKYMVEEKTGLKLKE
ncbi:MAG TPA: c-type cytochrome [Nitrococcus sp.]|nr:c-type cytochrome [Nitrococcus sp.]